MLYTLILFNLHDNPNFYSYHPHFTDEENWAAENLSSMLKITQLQVTEAGFEFRWSDCKVHAVSHYSQLPLIESGFC